MGKPFAQEPALAILVIDGKARYVNERHWREVGETVEAYADRVRAQIVRLLTTTRDS